MQKWWVDTDNALGSGKGDIDDAFAVAHMMSRLDPTSVMFTPTCGNASLAHALTNTTKLNQRLFQNRHCVSDSPDQLRDFAKLSHAPDGQRIKVLALGPLTNIAQAWERRTLSESDIEEISVIGLNSATTGRWPPFFPMEFNITQDLASFRRVWESPVPLRIFPLNTIKSLRFAPKDLQRMSPQMSKIFSPEVRRWIRRCTLLKGRRWFPVWDLCAAVYATHPHFFTFVKSFGKLHANGFVKFGDVDRPVLLLESFDEKAVWQAFWERFTT